MQLRDVNYYSDVLISIDIYAQSHSKRALVGGGGDRTKCILINYRINEGGPSQVGGSYSWGNTPLAWRIYGMEIFHCKT